MERGAHEHMLHVGCINTGHTTHHIASNWIEQRAQALPEPELAD